MKFEIVSIRQVSLILSFNYIYDPWCNCFVSFLIHSWHLLSHIMNCLIHWFLNHQPDSLTTIWTIHSLILEPLTWFLDTCFETVFNCKLSDLETLNKYPINLISMFWHTFDIQTNWLEVNHTWNTIHPTIVIPFQ